MTTHKSCLRGAIICVLVFGCLGRSEAFASRANRRCRAIKMTLALAREQGLAVGNLQRLKRLYCTQRRARGVLGATRAGAGAIVLYGQTDRCSGEMEASLGALTNCASLSRHKQSWSIRMGGRCIDTQDMSLQRACYRFAGGVTAPRPVEVFRSESCGSALIAVLGPDTNCHALSSSGTDAWAVRLGGRCINISDTSLRQACLTYRGASSAGARLRFFSSDTCHRDNLQTIVGADTSCDQYRGINQQARSLKAGGRCIDIQDMPLSLACSLHHGLTSPSRKVEIYKSDSCGDGELQAIIGPRTRCDWFVGQAQVAWAIKANGRCIDITDTNLRSACTRYKYSAR